MHRRSVTSSLADSAEPYYGRVVEPVNEIKLSPDMVVSVVCSTLGVAESELRGKRRFKSISRARQMTVFVLHELSGLSRRRAFQFIGQSESSALYTFRRAEILLEHDDSFRRDHTSVLNAIALLSQMRAA